MNSFLKLHNIESNSIVMVNENNIGTIITSSKNHSIIHLVEKCNVNPFIVNESPENIYNNIDKTKFIRTHLYKDNSVCLININSISIIDSNTDKGSVIYVNDFDLEEDIEINESPEKVADIILKIKEKNR